MRGAVAERVSRTEIDQFNETLDALGVTTLEELTLYLSALESQPPPSCGCHPVFVADNFCSYPHRLSNTAQE
jgi:hypothetical protein